MEKENLLAYSEAKRLLSEGLDLISSSKKKDRTLAAQYFERALELGCEAAVYPMAECFACGYGVKKNAEKAEALYRRAAENGEARGWNALGAIWEEKSSESMEQAVQAYHKAAEGGDVWGMYNFAWCLRSGAGVEQDLDGAMDWYKAAAEKGAPQAQCALAYLLLTDCEKPDESAAVQWYEKAAQQNDARAMVSLAYCLRSGKGTAQDKKRAAQLDFQAAELGDPDGLYNAGCHYLFGESIAKDEAQAASCFCKAAKLLHPRARYNWAVCLAKGIGTEKNTEEAARLCRLVKRSGDAQAADAAAKLLASL